jgi:L-threonylcarbamoyladenylate synthase
MGPQLMVLDGGPCDAGIESAIIDCTGTKPRLLRPGHLPRATMEAALGQALQEPEAQSPRVSGSLDSHYAPQAQLVLCKSDELQARLIAMQQEHGRHAVALWSRQRRPTADLSPESWTAMPDNAVDAAHQLFDTLRRWDTQGFKAICVELPPDDEAWEGVLDRLRRAAAPR